jgi:hypothetical protein
MTSPGKVPPHNLDAEQAVLGSMLLDAETAEPVVRVLRLEDFYRTSHRRLLEAMRALRDRGEPVDLVTVTDHLRTSGHLDEAGGAAYITGLMQSVPTAANVAHYVGIVRRDGWKRTLAEVFGEAGRGVCNGHDPTEVVTLVRRVLDGFDSFVQLSRSKGVNERITAAALANDPTLPDVEWIPFLRQAGIVGCGLVTLLSALAKTGKTTLLVHGVRALVRSTPGFRVVWITEEPRGLWKTRLRQFPELASPDLVLVFARGERWSTVLSGLEAEETDLVVVDTVRTVCGIADENDQGAVSAALLPLVFLTRRKNWALVLVHHLRKSPADVGVGHAGSHAFVGLVEVAVELHRDPHSRTRRVCKTVSRYDATPSEWVLELREGEMHTLGDPGLLDAAETVRRVEAVLDTVPRTRQEIAALIDPPPSQGALHNALTTLVKEGRAVPEGRGTRGNPLRWRRSDSFIHDLSLYVNESITAG